MPPFNVAAALAYRETERDELLDWIAEAREDYNPYDADHLDDLDGIAEVEHHLARVEREIAQILRIKADVQRLH